jgi:hypothetical protein
MLPRLEVIYFCNPPLLLYEAEKEFFSLSFNGEVSMCVSQKFIAALKLNPVPAYKIAWSAGVNPTMLSKLINGIERPKPDDPRIVNVGRVLGIPAEECFDATPEDQCEALYNLG